MHLDGLTGGNIRKAVGETVGQLGDNPGLSSIELAPRDLGPQHEITGVFGLLAIHAVPLEALEIFLCDRCEAALRISINVMNDGQPVFLLLEFLLRG